MLTFIHVHTRLYLLVYDLTDHTLEFIYEYISFIGRFIHLSDFPLRHFWYKIILLWRFTYESKLIRVHCKQCLVGIPFLKAPLAENDKYKPAKQVLEQNLNALLIPTQVLLWNQRIFISYKNVYIYIYIYIYVYIYKQELIELTLKTTVMFWNAFSEMKTIEHFKRFDLSR